MGNHGGMSFSHSHGRLSATPFQFIFDFDQTVTCQIHIKDHADGFCLLGIDKEIHYFRFVRQ